MQAEQLALILAALVGGGAGFARDAVTQEAPKTSPTLSRAELLRCVARLSPRRDPRIIAYGDSVTRGVFFNLVELLNSTDPYTTRIHAGHSANYSLGCARVQRRGQGRAFWRRVAFRSGAEEANNSTARAPLRDMLLFADSDADVLRHIRGQC